MVIPILESTTGRYYVWRLHVFTVVSPSRWCYNLIRKPFLGNIAKDLRNRRLDKCSFVVHSFCKFFCCSGLPLFLNVFNKASFGSWWAAIDMFASVRVFPTGWLAKILVTKVPSQVGKVPSKMMFAYGPLQLPEFCCWVQQVSFPQKLGSSPTARYEKILVASIYAYHIYIYMIYHIYIIYIYIYDIHIYIYVYIYKT